MPENPVRQFEPKPERRKLKLTDVLIVVVFLIIIGFLANMLAGQLSLKHEVNDARGTTNKMITDIQKRDATDAWKLGSPNFKAKYPAQQLGNLFKPLSGALVGTPEVVKQTADNGSANEVVSVYYKFMKPKTYFMVVTVYRPNDHKIGWQMINFSGAPTLNALLKLK